MVQIAPYGSWKSPIAADDVFARVIGIEDIRITPDGLYWSERRPDGQTVIVRRTTDGAFTDLVPAPYNVRNRVHEYGGADYTVSGGMIYFANFADQRLYCVQPGAEPQPLTHLEGMRYADALVDSLRGRLIVVREDHTTGAAQPVNSLAVIDLQSGAEQVLLVGNDFYASPRLSLDGTRLAWLTWNHPDMPWDGTELWVADLADDGTLSSPALIAGGPEESIFQPEWSPDGTLYFVSDRTGWWNLYRWRAGQIEDLLPMEAEFGLPQWVFGMSMYGLESADRLICTYTQHGLYYLGALDTASLEFTRYDIPYTMIANLRVDAGYAYFTGASATLPEALVRIDLANGATEVVRRTREVAIDATYFSVGRAIEFPTEGGLTAHGFFYPPQNRDFSGPDDERPPLLVMSHGGPTSAVSGVFRYSIQYWTTRGFAVLDVNYGGSTGYGRAYRERLNDQWGLVDVADCVNGARYLVEQGLADGERLAIRGGSAGGFTTLCALTFHDTFKAGASYYGIADLEALARDTHKFESRYLDRLVGRYPEQRDIYVARSPIHHTRQLACPMIILQGLEDPVVPPNQAQMMYEAVRSRELPVAYLTFAGERHGFVKAENNRRAIESEVYFYSKIFRFELADAVEPVEIENL